VKELQARLEENEKSMIENQTSTKKAHEKIEKARVIKREVASEVKSQIFQ
jgi:hypothetical protein